MIIDLRGTNGSGKSTIARKFLGEFTGLSYYNSERDLYVLGPYTMPTGGCDQMKPHSLVYELIDMYHHRNVLFESAWSSYSMKFTVMANKYPDYTFLFLSTPLDLCIEQRSRRRRESGRKDNGDNRVLTNSYHKILKVRDTLVREGYNVEYLSAEEAEEWVYHHAKRRIV